MHHRRKTKKNTPGENRREQNVKEATRLLEQLREKSRLGIPIIVEGRNDAKALKELGIDEDSIVKLKETGRKTLSEIAWDAVKRTTTIQNENVTRNRVVIILTDPDMEGKKMAHELSQMIEAYGAHPELQFMRITRLLGKGAVEELCAGDVTVAHEEDFSM